MENNVTISLRSMFARITAAFCFVVFFLLVYLGYQSFYLMQSFGVLMFVALLPLVGLYLRYKQGVSISLLLVFGFSIMSAAYTLLYLWGGDSVREMTILEAQLRMPPAAREWGPILAIDMISVGFNRLIIMVVLFFSTSIAALMAWKRAHGLRPLDRLLSLVALIACLPYMVNLFIRIFSMITDEIFGQGADVRSVLIFSASMLLLVVYVIVKIYSAKTKKLEKAGEMGNGDSHD